MSSQVTRGQTRSECRVGGGPVPVGSQRTDEATVQKRKVSSQVTQSQVRSSCREGGPAPVGSEDRRGHSTEEGGVQPGHSGQARSECRGGPAPVGSQRTDEVTVQKREVSTVQSGHTRSGEVKVQIRRRSSYSRITEDRRGHSTEVGCVLSVLGLLLGQGTEWKIQIESQHKKWTNMT